MAKKRSKGRGWHGQPKRHSLAAKRGAAGGSGAGGTAPKGGLTKPGKLTKGQEAFLAGRRKVLARRKRETRALERKAGITVSRGMQQVSSRANIGSIATKALRMTVPRVPNMGRVINSIEQHRAGGR